jgi:hypothetical protein
VLLIIACPFVIIFWRLHCLYFCDLPLLLPFKLFFWPLYCLPFFDLPFLFYPIRVIRSPPIRLKADEYYTTDGRWRHTNTIFTTTQFCSRLRKNRIKQYCKKKKNNNHLHLNYVLFYCTQLILSPITMWVRTSFMARCTRYNIVW